MPYLTLLIAILAETAATSALKASAGFTRPWPSIIVVLGYGISFYCLSLTLRTMPVGVAYAIWSGIGIVLISMLAWLLFDQVPDLAAVIGMALILCGVLVVNLFSRSGSAG
ncbi:multidrug efflux SMR transporter [Lichenicola cladoniae]|uniref:Multidrug efflux SMR transporter n=1 Tax=Lichenicola cladoniae TaxID=1484109 RepID=A0A6M8HRF7_9PROT|nr:multidrug efflux SMR transporter [Lichenicola cladoniae]NPD69105.1 multidrug efflux SMR transporter [Acetobacteraceae bacterium]QKE90928.1 multidrug efflux SMR transporter [Lichenicola cladoniae]